MTSNISIRPGAHGTTLFQALIDLRGALTLKAPSVLLYCSCFLKLLVHLDAIISLASHAAGRQIYCDIVLGRYAPLHLHYAW